MKSIEQILLNKLDMVAFDDLHLKYITMVTDKITKDLSLKKCKSILKHIKMCNEYT